MLDVNMKLINEENGVVTPSYGTPGANGMDCYSTISGIIKPGEKLLVPLGFSMELPEGYCALLLPRSGMATKRRITLANSPGLIDSDYRGECKACLINEGTEDQIINKGDKVCQLLIIQSPKVNINIVKEISETERGSNGFGSTGVK